MKRVVTGAILLFAMAGVFYVVLGGSVEAPERGLEATETPSAQSVEAPDDSLLVYYFDMGKDCTTCLNLESYTLETLKEHFSDQLASGAIVWRVVDVDQPENEHFVTDFGLYTKSVVIARMEGGERVFHENLSRIWELVCDKEAYMAYIRDQVTGALGALP